MLLLRREARPPAGVKSITVNTIAGRHARRGRVTSTAAPAPARATSQYFGLAVGPRQG
jgi:hypothetical protein